MMKLKLYKRAEWYLFWLLDQGYLVSYAEEKDKVYTCVGEFEHAPGHVLMCEFGKDWKFSGMHEISNFEELKSHPGDVSISV